MSSPKIDLSDRPENPDVDSLLGGGSSPPKSGGSIFPKPGEHRMNANVPRDLFVAFKAEAQRQKMTVTAMLVRLMKAHLREVGAADERAQTRLFEDPDADASK